MFQFEGTGSYAGGRLWIIDKNGFYAGGAASVNVFDPITASGAVGVTLMPAQVYGNVPGAASTFLVGYSSLSDGTNEFAEVIRIDNPLAGPTFTSQFVNLGNIETTTGLLDAPQLGTATLIETNDSRALNAVWRDGSLYFASTIRGTGGDLNEATAYWAQISTANQAALALTQGGTISGDNVLGSDAATFFPSIAVNGDGDIGVGFSGVSSSTYAGAYFAWRDVNDPLGTLRTPLTVQAGQDYYVRTFGGTRNRWGDYTATVVDPSNDLSFWTFNQYAQTRGTTLNGEDGRWATVWGQFNEAVVAPGPVTLRNAVGTTVNTFATIQAAENAASANFSIEVASTGYAANPEAVTTDLNGLTITIPLGVTPTITLLEAGNVALTIAGAGNATVIGNSVGNALTTGSGNDTLNGAGGTDALAGGAGDDVYIINDGGGDLVTEIVGQGNDEVRTTQATHLLAANVELLTYTGAAAFTGTGNAAANIITGGALGDTLDGGLGLDTLYGGAGNDVYILNSDADDVIVESAAQGIDDVRTHQSAHFLAANVENVLYTGFGSLFAIGNAENNQITTGAGFDSLYGGAGGDTIYGGASEDVIVGDSGNDSLFGGSGGDVISELFDPLNSGNDTIDGGDNVDIIYSAAGNDSVFGGTDAANNYANLGDGLDSYFGAPGSDVVEGGNGADTINGNAGDDSLFGDDGDDVIFGGSGIDLLAGSTGNDSLDGGDDNDQLVGDGGNDTLRGGDGIDILYGFGDADTLNGGAGGDVDALYGGGGADVFQVGGVDFDYDYIWDFESGSDKIHLETGATITLQYASGTNYFIDLSNGSHVVVVGVIDVLGSDIVLNGF